MRSDQIRRLSALVSALIIGTSGVHAQQVAPSPASDTGTNASPLTKPPAPPAETPGPGEATGYVFNLQPLGYKLGQDLADKGIYVTGRTLQQAVGVVGGGRKEQSIYEGFNLLGLDLDMGRIAGINGGSFHFLVSQLSGLSAANYTGSTYVYNRAFGGIAATRLNEFSYEQTFGDRLDLRVGRVPIGSEFDFSPLYCEFIYGTCALPAGYAFTKGYPSYLTASTAGIAKVNLTHDYYFNIGAFEDEPALSQLNHYNWPGEDWAPDKARGVTIPMQIGYRSSYKDDPYPRAFDIGGYIDTGDYNDPYANASGQNRLTSGGAARLDHGKSGVWLQAEQTIWRSSLESSRNLTVFVGANFQTSGEANINNDYFGGFSFRGPLPLRANDSLNLIGSVIDLNHAYTAYENTSLRLRGYTSTLSSTEAYVELN